MEQYPSIFNDVMGPIMRGPSSSHCAASLRIGRLCRALMDDEITDILIEFDPNGSLATTHKSQGSDMGLFGGFLGWEAYDEQLKFAEDAIKGAGININIEIVDIGFSHPNTYKITLTNTKETRQLIAISTGGGMIEVIEIDGNKVSMAGDYYETLVYCKQGNNLKSIINTEMDYDEFLLHEGDIRFAEIRTQQPLDDILYHKLLDQEDVLFIKQLQPVLPVLSRKNLKVPFITCEEMLQYNEGKDLALWELSLHYESARGNISHDEVWSKMEEIVNIMESSIHSGLKGTEYSDRILGCQSVGFKEKLESNRLLGGDLSNRIIMFVTSMMEVKSSMGVIVAAPTAGSCGVIPGALIGTASSLNLPKDEVIKAMLSAGIIGVFIAAHATFAAEVGGCQAECGSGSGMAAAALVGMSKGTLHQSLCAASIALQNSLGMICDPVANRVEAPCLGKNVMAATNALSCANMALAGYDHLIPLDEVIHTMDQVGHSIPNTLRCTSLGGLSITKTSKEIEERLNQRMFKSC